MGHYIRGAVGSKAALDRFCALLPVAIAPVPLDAAMWWCPSSEETMDAIDDADAAPVAERTEDRAFAHLTPRVAGLHAIASGDGGLAYIETEYFGGVGEQRAAFWIRGDRALGLGTVNQALALLGVRAVSGKDEWDAVGLRKHRHMPA